MADSGTTFSYAPLVIAKDQKQSRLFKLLTSLARLAIGQEQKQIRLLKLLPSRDTDQISCTLEVVNWTPKLQYAAISYVWGDPSIKKAISVNDQPFFITENLYTALWHIRKNDMLRKDGSEHLLPLWADAVCINQDNNEERNHQVSLMGSIYGSASKVIYWLGQLEDDALRGEAAITAIREMAEAAFHDSSVLDTESLKNFLAAHEGLNTIEPGDAMLLGLPPIWASIADMMVSEFWRRIWIIQEIALPVSQDDLQFTCGNSTVTWTRILQFSQIVNIIDESSDGSFGLPVPVHHGLSTCRSKFNIIPLLRRLRERDVQPKPGNLPLLSPVYKATNPLDYVYGFRAVLAIEAVVDYNKSKKEVYMDWFKDAMQYDPVSFLVVFAGIGWHGPANQEWPSWLPDLASLDDGPIKLTRDMGVVEPDSQQPPGDIDGNVLHISGVRLRDTVAKVFEPEPGAPKQEIGSTMHYVCFSILANASNHHPLGVTPLQAFFITLVDCFMDNPNNNLSFEHPLDKDDPQLGLIISCLASHDPYPHPKSYDDYLSMYGQGWVSMGLRDRDHLVDSLREQFLGDLPLPLPRQLPLAMAHIAAALNLDLNLEKHATFQTTNGHIGIGPPGIKEGDELCLFSQREPPRLLRLEKENDSMVTKFVGVCYIHESSVAVMKDSIASRSAEVERFSLH